METHFSDISLLYNPTTREVATQTSCSAMPIRAGRKMWITMFSKFRILMKARKHWAATGCYLADCRTAGIPPNESLVRVWNSLDAWLVETGAHCVCVRRVPAVMKAPPTHINASIGKVPFPPIPKSLPRRCVSASVQSLKPKFDGQTIKFDSNKLDEIVPQSFTDTVHAFPSDTFTL